MLRHHVPALDTGALLWTLGASRKVWSLKARSRIKFADPQREGAQSNLVSSIQVEKDAAGKPRTALDVLRPHTTPKCKHFSGELQRLGKHWRVSCLSIASKVAP